MNKKLQEKLCMLPMIIWIIVIPLVVKIKYFKNPLLDYPWYSGETTLADFFLYYRSILITAVGACMFLLLLWQLVQQRRKCLCLNADTNIFIPLIGYMILVVLSSLFSEYGYFCTHGMPDQFETVWCILAYVTAVFYSYYIIISHNAEKRILTICFIGAAIVGLICALQYFKIDLYRIIYAGKGYSFSFEEGTVYGPFYNINYVGYYTLLFTPLFILLALFYKNLKVKITSTIISVLLLISMWGAKSSTAIISFVGVSIFAVLFILFKNSRKKKILWAPIFVILTAGFCVCILLFPYISAYILVSDTEKTELENIYTHDDNVEIDYKGEKLFVSLSEEGNSIMFSLSDQNQQIIPFEEAATTDGYSYYNIIDERFSDIRLTPILLSQESPIYGFMLTIDGKDWCFTNQMTDDGTFYYYTDIGKLAKLTEDTVSDDFEPLVHMSSLANGRGYIWNKTITLLKNYVILGSGADTFTLVYPNGDFVDKYNNGYDNLILSKPHNLYLQIAVQTGMLSLICFLVFYGWYFVSSLRLYFRLKFDNILTVVGFAIMLGTLGYMISGIANDSTITVAPLYWALIGTGIGINNQIKARN